MSDNYAISLKRSTALAAAITFTAMLTVVNFASIFSNKVGAAQLQERSMTMASTLPGTSTTGAANSPTNGSNTTHTFTFDVSTTASIGGIEFRYCQTAIGACVMPVDLDTSGATLGSPTGLTGWALDSSAAGVIRIDNGTPQAKTISDQVIVPFSAIGNPSTINTFFVRITTFEDNTFTGGEEVDEGTVAGSTTEGIQITSRVVETLGFSTTGDPSGIPVPTGCAALSGSGAIQLGDPTDNTLSISETFDAYSAFRLYTNSALGATVQYNGATLTKGVDNIDAIGGTPEATTGGGLGSEQFGLAVDQSGGTLTNTDTSWEEYPTNTAGQLSLISDYATGAGDIGTEAVGADAEFAFVAGNTPQTIARSDSFVECATGAVRYAANISPLTPSGTYTTTVVYHAVPQY